MGKNKKQGNKDNQIWNLCQLGDLSSVSKISREKKRGRTGKTEGCVEQ